MSVRHVQPELLADLFDLCWKRFIQVLFVACQEEFIFKKNNPCSMMSQFEIIRLKSICILSLCAVDIN